MHTLSAVSASRALAAPKTRSALLYGTAWLIATCLSTWALVAAGTAS